MSQRFKYKAIAGTAKNLFKRMAYDEVDNTTEFANHILEFVRDKISEADYAKLKQMLMGEGGDEDAPVRGAKARAGAMDSAAEADFYSRFPGAKRIGRDPFPGGFR